MSKRKPDRVVVHRIEMQQHERDLLKDAMILQNINALLESMSRVKPETLYAWLTLFEGLGLLDTPIPTLGDYPENGILNALKSMSQQRYDEIETKREEQGEQLNWFERNLSDQAIMARFFGWLDEQA